MTKALVTLTLVLHGLLLVALFWWPGYRADLSTIPFDFGRGLDFLSGQLMYRDFQFEYPPLAGLFYTLPHILADDETTYRVTHAVQMGLIDMGVALITCLWLIRRNQPPLPTLLAQAIFLLAAGVMIVLERFDLAVACLTLLALYLWPVANGLWSWACVALGMGIKLYPAVLIPLLIVDHLRRRDWTTLLAGVLVATVILIVPFLPLIVIAPESLTKLLEYHLARGIQIESLLATPLLIGHWLGAPTQSLFAFGSQEVSSSISPQLASLALPLLLLSNVVVTWGYARGPAHEERRLRYASAAILGFMLFNKVLSAQYMIWLYPLLPLIQTRRALVWGFYGVALVLTQYLYPHGWNELVNMTPFATGVQTLRNTLLLGLWVALMVEPRTEARRADKKEAMAPATSTVL